MRRTLRPLLALGLIVALAAGGCGTGTTAGGGGAGVRKVAAAEAVPMIDARTVIDVRTPEEFEQGHVEGALNIDVEASDFATRIAELDPKAPYLVYCRTGRRSAIAAQRMAEAGFTDVLDAGALADLTKAGASTE